MKFTTKEELIAQAIQDDACYTGIEFANSCKSLNEIFETIDKDMRLWCLRKGYEQFADHAKLNEFNAVNWRLILIDQPQLAEKCDKFNEFSVYDWRWLLSDQPQLAEKCDKLGKFDACNWRCLLIKQPQFSYRCDKWDEFDFNDWIWLLSYQPQLAAYRK